MEHFKTISCEHCMFSPYLVSISQILLISFTLTVHIQTFVNNDTFLFVAFSPNITHACHCQGQSRIALPKQLFSPTTLASTDDCTIGKCRNCVTFTGIDYILYSPTGPIICICALCPIWTLWHRQQIFSVFSNNNQIF